MERSQSCVNFVANNNCENNSLTSNSATTTAFDLRQTIVVQQKHLHHTGSNGDLCAIVPLNRQHYKKKSGNSRRRLQRQKTEEFIDEVDFVGRFAEVDEGDEGDADEYDGDYDDHELSGEHPLLGHPRMLPIAARLLHLKKHKMRNCPPYESHSHVALNTSAIPTALSSPSSASERRRRLKHDHSFDSTTSTTPSTPSTDPVSPLSDRKRQTFGHCRSLMRDNSTHSDSSRYSSVDSLLEARKPDPEAILVNLGFGSVDSEDILSRIPKRFLKPSQVRGIDTEAFVKRLQLASSLAENSVLGYRGLTGNPDMPPSSIVAKIMERFEVNQRKQSMGCAEHALR